MQRYLLQLDDDTLSKIKDLQNHKDLKAWQPTKADIIRVSISHYWEEMTFPHFKKNPINKTQS